MLRPFAFLPAIALTAFGVAGAIAHAAEGGDAPSTATRIAAAVIAERAREQAMSGGGPIAAQLDALARALAAGQVTLNDAALVMHIAMAGAMAPPRPLSANAPKITPEQVVALLDGTAPPAATSPPAPAAAPLTPNPAPASTPPLPPQFTPVGAAVASVLAVGRGGDGKTSLVMVSAGSDKHLAKGQRLLVMRNDTLVAQLGVSDLRDTMAVCVILAPAGTVDAEIKEGDAVFASGE